MNVRRSNRDEGEVGGGRGGMEASKDGERKGAAVPREGKKQLMLWWVERRGRDAGRVR